MEFMEMLKAEWTVIGLRAPIFSWVASIFLLVLPLPKISPNIPINWAICLAKGWELSKISPAKKKSVIFTNICKKAGLNPESEDVSIAWYHIVNRSCRGLI